MIGDTPGWGQLGGRLSSATMQECTKLCTEKQGCCSVEYSPTRNLCNLNSDCEPSAEPHEDFIFCSHRKGIMSKVNT